MSTSPLPPDSGSSSAIAASTTSDVLLPPTDAHGRIISSLPPAGGPPSPQPERRHINRYEFVQGRASPELSISSTTGASSLLSSTAASSSSTTVPLGDIGKYNPTEIDAPKSFSEVLARWPAIRHMKSKKDWPLEASRAENRIRSAIFGKYASSEERRAYSHDGFLSMTEAVERQVLPPGAKGTGRRSAAHILAHQQAAARSSSAPSSSTTTSLSTGASPTVGSPVIRSSVIRAPAPAPPALPPSPRFEDTDLRQSFITMTACTMSAHFKSFSSLTVKQKEWLTLRDDDNEELLGKVMIKLEERVRAHQKGMHDTTLWLILSQFVLRAVLYKYGNRCQCGQGDCNHRFSERELVSGGYDWDHKEEFYSVKKTVLSPSEVISKCLAEYDRLWEAIDCCHPLSVVCHREITGQQNLAANVPGFRTKGQARAAASSSTGSPAAPASPTVAPRVEPRMVLPIAPSASSTPLTTSAAAARAAASQRLFAKHTRRPSITIDDDDDDDENVVPMELDSPPPARIVSATTLLKEQTVAKEKAAPPPAPAAVPVVAPPGPTVVATAPVVPSTPPSATPASMSPAATPTSSPSKKKLGTRPAAALSPSTRMTRSATSASRVGSITSESRPTTATGGTLAPAIERKRKRLKKMEEEVEVEDEVEQEKERKKGKRKKDDEDEDEEQRKLAVMGRRVGAEFIDPYD